jgi:hypothetical protein
MVLQLASAKNLKKNACCVIRISDVGYLTSKFVKAENQILTHLRNVFNALVGKKNFFNQN